MMIDVSYFLKKSIKYILSVTYLTILHIILYVPITYKYKKDSSVLPLTKAHKKLYFIIHNYYFKMLFKFPDLIKCNDINEKIQWLKLFDQTKNHILCSDKILVKGFVDEILKNDGESSPKTLCVVEDLHSLNIESLPFSCIVKTNHDSGTNMIIRRSDEYSILKKTIYNIILKSKMKLAIMSRFGYDTGEWAYTFVEKKIFAEALIDVADKEISDYKFYVVDGKVKFCHHITDRETKAREQIVLPDGKLTNYQLHKKFPHNPFFTRPRTWNKMISIAEKLGANFRFVRVDLYSVEDSVLVGEMTFWPQAGCYKGKDIELLGDMLDYDRKQVFDPIFK